MVKRSFTTGEVAYFCGVSFRTVIQWIKRGHLNAYQLPGRGDNRIGVGDLLNFMEEYGMPIPEEFQNHDTASRSVKVA